MQFIKNRIIPKTVDNEFESCIMCHKLTYVRKDKNIQTREFYIYGAGQLCIKCFYETYCKKEG